MGFKVFKVQSNGREGGCMYRVSKKMNNTPPERSSGTDTDEESREGRKGSGH